MATFLFPETQSICIAFIPVHNYFLLLQIIILLCFYIFASWYLYWWYMYIFLLRTSLLINSLVHVAAYADTDTILQRVSFSRILNAIQPFKSPRPCVGVWVPTPIFHFYPFISIVIVLIVTCSPFSVTKIVHLADRQRLKYAEFEAEMILCIDPLKK